MLRGAIVEHPSATQIEEGDALRNAGLLHERAENSEKRMGVSADEIYLQGAETGTEEELPDEVPGLGNWKDQPVPEARTPKRCCKLA